LIITKFIFIEIAKCCTGDPVAAAGIMPVPI
jgi:hypothetical protein